MGRPEMGAAHAGGSGDGSEPTRHGRARHAPPGMWGPLGVFVLMQIGSIAIRVALGERRAILVLWMVAIVALTVFVLYEVRRPTPAERAHRAAGEDRAPAAD